MSTNEPLNTARYTGFFHTIWNGEAHYHLTEANGQSFKLRIDPAVLARYGGAAMLDRKQVCVNATQIKDALNQLQVISFCEVPR